MADYYPPYIFGLHDRGGESLMLHSNKRGWVLVTEALGADPNHYGGSDYTDLAYQGLGVIARLNHGYGAAGTIPNLQVQNAGRLSWPRSGEQAVRLGYRWLDAQGAPVPVDAAEALPLPREIAPGEAAVFRDLEFVAPSSPGSYRLVWDLSQAGVWLSGRGVAALERSVQVVVSEYGVGWEVVEPFPTNSSPHEPWGIAELVVWRSSPLWLCVRKA